jgi:hypothetical protein
VRIKHSRRKELALDIFWHFVGWLGSATITNNKSSG